MDLEYGWINFQSPSHSRPGFPRGPRRLAELIRLAGSTNELAADSKSCHWNWAPAHRKPSKMDRYIRWSRANCGPPAATANDVAESNADHREPPYREDCGRPDESHVSHRSQCEGELSAIESTDREGRKRRTISWSPSDSRRFPRSHGSYSRSAGAECCFSWSQTFASDYLGLQSRKLASVRSTI